MKRPDRNTMTDAAFREAVLNLTTAPDGWRLYGEWARADAAEQRAAVVRRLAQRRAPQPSPTKEHTMGQQTNENVAPAPPDL